MSTFEFDSTYRAADGLYAGNPFPPDVAVDPRGDVTVSGGWRVITGKTGQHGYSGAIMHQSETADDATILRWVQDAGATHFAIVEVRDEDGDYPGGDPIGWAVAYI